MQVQVAKLGAALRSQLRRFLLREQPSLRDEAHQAENGYGENLNHFCFHFLLTSDEALFMEMGFQYVKTPAGAGSRMSSPL
jgi:hypothetical protein